MNQIFLWLLVAILSKGSLCLDYTTEKPDFLDSCSIRDRNFIQCSTKSMQQLFDQMREGIPKIKNLQRSDPYKIRKVKLSQNNEAANLNAELTNVVITGLGQTSIKENVVDENDYTFKTKFFIPKLRIDSDYKMDGRLLLLTLKGHGKLFIEMDNIDMKTVTKVHLYEKGDLTFGNVTAVKVDFKIQQLKTKLDNLFNGAVELEEPFNSLLNENWMDFLEALRPTLTQTVESILLDNFEKIFHYIPAKYFISDIPTSQQLYGAASLPKQCGMNLPPSRSPSTTFAVTMNWPAMEYWNNMLH